MFCYFLSRTESANNSSVLGLARSIFSIESALLIESARSNESLLLISKLSGEARYISFLCLSAPADIESNITLAISARPS